MTALKEGKKPRKYYLDLQVSEGATQAEISRSYRKLFAAIHSDRRTVGTPEEEELIKNRTMVLCKAYSILKGPDSRAVYDKYGMHGVTGGKRLGFSTVRKYCIWKTKVSKFLFHFLGLLTCCFCGFCCCCCCFCCGTCKEKDEPIDEECDQYEKEGPFLQNPVSNEPGLILPLGWRD